MSFQFWKLPSCSSTSIWSCWQINSSILCQRFLGVKRMLHYLTVSLYRYMWTWTVGSDVGRALGFCRICPLPEAKPTSPCCVLKLSQHMPLSPVDSPFMIVIRKLSLVELSLKLPGITGWIYSEIHLTVFCGFLNTCGFSVDFFRP